MHLSRPLVLAVMLLTVSLNIRLSHDNRKGYTYSITGPSVEEVIEADQKMRGYLKSLTPKKVTVPTPSKAAPGTVLPKR